MFVVVLFYCLVFLQIYAIHLIFNFSRQLVMTQFKKTKPSNSMEGAFIPSQEYESIKRQLQDSANTIYMLKKENEVLSGKEQELQKLKEQTRNLSKKAITQAKSILRYKEMQKDMNLLTKQKEEKDATINEMQTKIKQFKQLQLLVSQKQQIINDNIARNRIELDRKNEIIAQLQEHKRENNLQIKHLQGRVNDVNSLLNQKDEVIARFQQSIHLQMDKMNKMYKMQTNYESTSQQLKLLKSKYQKIETLLHTLQSQNTKMRQERNELINDNIKLSNQYGDILQGGNRLMEDKEQQLILLNAKYEKLQIFLHSLQQQSSKMKKQMSQLINQNIKLSNQHGDVLEGGNKLLEQKEKELILMRSKYQRTQILLHSLQSQNTKMKEQRTQLINQNIKLGNQYGDILEGGNRLVEDKEQQLTLLKSRCKTLQINLHTLQSQNAEMREQRNDLINENIKLSDQYSNILQGGNELMNDKEQQLKSLKSKYQKLQILLHIAQSQISKMKEQMNDLRNDNIKLGNQYGDALQEINDLMQEKEKEQKS